MTVSFSVDAERHIQKSLADLGVQELRQAPREHRRRILREAEAKTNAHVFGPDAKKDADGNFIEQGIGSWDNVTKSHIEAYIRSQTVLRDTPEQGYEENLAAIRAQLAVCEARRRAEQKKEDDELDALPLAATVI
jgi:hypothetical protein